MAIRETLDTLIDLFIPELRNAFLGAIQNVVDNAVLMDVIKAIESGDVEAAFRSLGFSDAAMRPLTAVIEQAFERGGVLTGGTFPRYLNTPSGRAVFYFDVRNSRAEAYLRDHSSSLVTRIREDTRVAVRNVLTDGMQLGDNPRRVALDIIGRVDPVTRKRVGGIVGLTPGQERWVGSARNKLANLDDSYFQMELRDKRSDSVVRRAIAEGRPLNRETIDRLIIGYKNNALKYRGETIARTEALQSLNQSEYEAIKQAVDLGAVDESAVRRHWDSAGDKRVRWSHKRMDAIYDKKGVGLDEPFKSPSGVLMMFPGDTSNIGGADPKKVAAEVVMCRCRVRLKVDWLADID